MTIISMLIGLSLFLWMPLLYNPVGRFEQITNSIKKQNASNFIERKDSIILSRLKNTRIVFKDGSIRKNCTVKEINNYWIVYEKDGSLHDLEIEKISRIEIGNGTMKAVFFDEKNKPGIRTYMY